MPEEAEVMVVDAVEEVVEDAEAIVARIERAVENELAEIAQAVVGGNGVTLNLEILNPK
jgi:hypothetical protein